MLNFLIRNVILFEFVRIVLVARLEFAERAALLDESSTTLMMFCLDFKSASIKDLSSALKNASSYLVPSPDPIKAPSSLF